MGVLANHCSGNDSSEHSKGVARNVILIFTGAAVHSVLIYHLSQTKSSSLFVLPN